MEKNFVDFFSGYVGFFWEFVDLGAHGSLPGFFYVVRVIYIIILLLLLVLLGAKVLQEKVVFQRVVQYVLDIVLLLINIINIIIFFFVGKCLWNVEIKLFIILIIVVAAVISHCLIAPGKFLYVKFIIIIGCSIIV